MNLAYFKITDGLPLAERTKIDVALAPPEKQDVLIAKQNKAAMDQLASMGMLPPPPPRKKP